MFFDSKNRSNSIYTMVSAISYFRQKRTLGTEKDVFLIVFEVDRKSPRSYIYRHLSDFEGSNKIDFSCFCKRRFLTFFYHGWQTGLRMSIDMSNETPLQKTELPKKGRFGGLWGRKKSHFGPL